MKNGKQNTNQRTSFFRLLTAFMLVAWTTTFSWSQIANAPCNLESPWIQGVGPGTYTNLEAKINDNVFSLLPPCLGSVSNVGDLIDGNLNNFAQIDITGIGCNATIGVRDKDAADTYPAGTFAGFNIGTGGLLPGATTALKCIQSEGINDLVSLLIGCLGTCTVIVAIPTNFTDNLYNQLSIAVPYGFSSSVSGNYQADLTLSERGFDANSLVRYF